jgi:Protein of unknown function (DUF4058)
VYKGKGEMQPVRSLKNQYLGINAHLHSQWQSEGGWDEFHMSHIVHLANGLHAQLRPMGYTANIKQSLQIRRYGEPAGKPESDVTIYDTDPTRGFTPQSQGSGIEVMTMTVPEIFNFKQAEVEQYRAVGIYTFEPGKRDQGEAVAWIELLSPSNKPGGQDANYYSDKRLKILQSGVVFVELDYLHETPPNFAGLPNYVNRGKYLRPQPGSAPYCIVVIDPRPTFMEGRANTHRFRVDDPLPTVPIPLNKGDIVSADFGSPYQRTFTEGFFGDDVDYHQFPLNFDRYSETDQARIAARMLAVLEAARSGIDLETGPFPTQALPDALAQIEKLFSGSV